jgi:mono/diheme cytochrome c family protein
LDSRALKDVIAATSHGPLGSDAWLGGADALREEVIERTTSGAHDNMPTIRENLGSKYLHDVGFLTGAMEADTMSTARWRMEQRDAVVGAIGVTSSKLPALGSIGANAVASYVSEAMPDHVDIARDEVLATQTELRRQYAGPVYQALIEHDLETVNPQTGELYTQAEAEQRSVGIDPDSHDTCSVFSNSFTDASDARSEHGDNQCAS